MGPMQPKMAERIAWRQTRKHFPEAYRATVPALRFTFYPASTGRDIKFDIGRMEGYRTSATSSGMLPARLSNCQNGDVDVASMRLSLLTGGY